MIGALVEEIYSDNKTWEFPNCSLDKPGWKGKGGGRGGKPKRTVTGQNESTTREDTEQDTNFTYNMLRVGGATGQNETTRTDSDQDSFAGTNFTYIFKRPLTSALPPVSD